MSYEGEGKGLSGFDLPGRSDLIHAAIGAGICFFVMFFFEFFAQRGFISSLLYFGLIGVMAFQEQFVLALAIFSFGTVYLLGGFLGGLYAGYQIEENLRVALAIPGIVGFIIYTVAMYLLGATDFSNIDLANRVLLPLVGNVAGAYLGGYAMNWPSEEEAESFEKLSLDV